MVACKLPYFSPAKQINPAVPQMEYEITLFPEKKHRHRSAQPDIPPLCIRCQFPVHIAKASEEAFLKRLPALPPAKKRNYLSIKILHQPFYEKAAGYFPFIKPADSVAHYRHCRPSLSCYHLLKCN